MNKSLVSIIIPTYNRADVISETIDNVFSQTYKNFELIVVDDGSTDGTPAILRKYANRIRVITQKNAGPAAARNRGIEVSGGDIIAFKTPTIFGNLLSSNVRSRYWKSLAIRCLAACAVHPLDSLVVNRTPHLIFRTSLLPMKRAC